MTWKLLLLSMVLLRVSAEDNNRYYDINDTIDFTNKLIDNSSDLENLHITIMQMSKCEKAEDYFDKSKNHIMMLYYEKLRTNKWSYTNFIVNSNIIFKSLNSCINEIDYYFRNFIQTIEELNGKEDICEFATNNTEFSSTIIQHNFSDMIQLWNVDITLTEYFHTVINEIKSLFMDQITYDCDRNNTIQGELFNIYDFFTSLERKLFIMKVFAYRTKCECAQKNCSSDIAEERTMLINRTQNYLVTVEAATKTASRSLRHCYLSINKSDQAYFELSGYQRSVIINEKDILFLDTCTSSCELYGDSYYIHPASLRARKPYCNGRLVNCISGGSLEVCKLSNDSSSRYQWIKNSYGQYYGSDTSECRGTIEHMDTWNRLLITDLCDYCICTCIDDARLQSPTRYGINFNAILSRNDLNEVITGIKFVLRKNIVYPQIQTGKILAKGYIQPNTVNWKPIIINSSQSTPQMMGKIKNIYFGTELNAVQRIRLDDINVDKGFVVTGVQFALKRENAQISSKYGVGLTVYLRVFAAEYNYTTGKLGNNNKAFQSINLTKKVKLVKPDNPSKFAIHVVPSKSGEFIEFRASDLTSDAGQSTVPFFDALELSANPSIALGGIGIYHNGMTGSGGYLAFKIMGLDMTQFINTNIPNENESE